MGWYKFIEGEPLGRLRVDKAQVCWYDMERLNGDCFDEGWIVHKGDNVETLQRIGKCLTYIELDENENKYDKSRVFIHMDDGSVYELLMKKLSKEEWIKCDNFYGGR